MYSEAKRIRNRKKWLDVENDPKSVTNICEIRAEFCHEITLKDMEVFEI